MQPDISTGVKAPIDNQFLAQRCVQGSGKTRAGDPRRSNNGEPHMSNVAYANFGQSQGIQPLSFDEIDAISGASELGDNVLLFAGAGGLIGSFAGPKGAAVGVLAGAAVGVIVTIFDN